MSINIQRHLVGIVLSCWSMSASACASDSPTSPEATSPPTDLATPAPPVAALELYRLPCGRVHVHDLDVFDRDGAYAGQEADFAASCFLVRHPEGDLLWDTGIKASFPAEGQRAGPFTLLPAPPLDQTLATLSLALSDIEWVALSHSHGDHIGNIRPFSASTLLMQAAEVDRVRAGADDSFVEDFARADHLLLLDGEHDVFGDGSVRIVPAPGHTEGHQVLVIQLPESGAVVISGDLWHFEENRRMRRVPRLNVDPEATLRSMDAVEAIITELGARLVIQHELASVESLPAFPEPLR